MSFCSPLIGDIDDYFKQKISPSSSNYGLSGIFEIPTARFMSEGSLRFSFSSSFPYEYTSLNASPFSWLEANYRYAEIKNKLYGPSFYSGNQSLKDKGFDLKVGILKETYYLPALAVGLRDIGGTGLFSSEYLVGTKQFNNLEMTAGIGWGQLGTANNIKNPLKSLDDRFMSRSSDLGQGGEFNYSDWFSGPAALFGGMEYHLRKYGLTLKVEYDTSQLDKRSDIPIPVQSRFNFGLNYQLSNSINLAIGLERGNTFIASFSFKGNFSKDTIPKPSPKNVIRLNEEQQARASSNKGIFYRSLNKSLQDESIYIQAANYNDESVDLAVASKRFYSFTRTAGRSARIASALSQKSVKEINVHVMNGDLEIATISLDRDEFDQADSNAGSPSELFYKSEMKSDSSNPLYKTADFKPTVKFPEFSWNMSPALKHQIGGPEAFYLGQLFWSTDTIIKFRRNLSLYTSFGINLYDTFSDFNNPSSSELPHVRSDIQDYLKEGKNNIQRMKLEYLFSPYKDIFVRADFGILEEMFAGVGGEVLYRPYDRRSAIGVSVHKVKQRGYNQLFSFREYETTTGHIGFHTNIRDVYAQLLVGKYLAGDKGATLDLSRRFKSGFTLGIFATKTDVPKEIFGEGSFDKGFYFSIPTYLFYSDFRTGNISFGLHPLTKDGGAILNQHNGLFGILGGTNRFSTERDWNNLLD
jgi:hypothetical protein